MGLLIVALRGAATLKARALKEVWNIAAVIPVEKGTVGGGQQHQKQSVPKQHHRKLECHGSSISDDVSLEGESNFLGICSQELLARGTELLKRTREGAVLVIISLVNDFCCLKAVRILMLSISLTGALHWKVVSVYINRMGLVRTIVLLNWY
jgi:hypothetical protein